MTTAWVLRGGASFGAAQVGMAQALIEAGHHPDMLYGTSSGALNASWLAADPTLEGLEELARLWTTVRRHDVFPLRPWSALCGLVGLRDFTVSADGLASWLRATALLRRLEDGVLPLVVAAADLENGEEVLLESGPAVPALLASSAMPGIFPPVRIGDRWLVDGSVASDSPIGAAVKAGASRVWLLPSAPTGPLPRPKRALDVVLRSTSIVLARQVESVVAAWASRCELFVVPAPLVQGVSPFSFTKSRELIGSAYRLTRQWLEAHPEPEL
ncbi:MAG TPA: patatin-like phospholipase family protein [Acidimicrobiales bacterium]|nr:patatin-like phospholipase family protein [Acidimicrobiales bacterium]